MAQTIGDLLFLEEDLLIVCQVLPCASTALVKVGTDRRDSLGGFGDNLANDPFAIASFGSGDFSHDRLSGEASFEENDLPVQVTDRFAVKSQVGHFKLYE